MLLYDELLSIHANLVQFTKPKTFTPDKFLQEAHQWNQTISELQKTIYASRFVPVQNLFLRLSKIVPELAKKWQGRQISVQTEGQDVEVDRILLEEITEIIVV
jgi:two-component system, chemotaxis family, sensor kinase CheA